jgi:tripartite-type tricarboxylate transporter receptor subunit TctC
MNTFCSKYSLRKGKKGEGFIRLSNFMIVGVVFFAIFGSALAADVDFPKKPIHIWLGYAPGAVSDLVIRKMAPTAERILGQPLVIESKAGGAGARALELLKSAKPDGYTLVGSTSQSLTHVPHMRHVKYEPFGDFTPLVLTYTMANGVVVKSDSPFKKFQDLIEYARKNPGKLTIGLPGAGTEPHMSMVEIAQKEKVEFQYVQFKGSVPTITAILGGHVNAVALLDARYMPHVKAGTLRVVLSLNPKGLEGFPEVPTSLQLGYDTVAIANGMLIAPKGLPKPVTDKLIDAFSEAKKTSDFHTFARERYLTIPDPLTADDLLKELRAGSDKAAQTISNVGLKKK